MKNSKEPMRFPSSALLLLVFVNYTLLFLDNVEVLEVEAPLVALFEGSLREGAGAARRLKESA
jgi:hypothetical protein